MTGLSAALGGSLGDPAAHALAAEVDAAQALYYVQDFSAARARLDRLLAREPDYAPALKLRSEVIARGAQDFPAALADLDAALASNPKDADAQERRARLLSEAGRPEEALAGANAALAQNPESAGAWLLRAKLAPRDIDLADLTRMEALAADDRREAWDRRRLWNAVGRVRDKRNDIDAAFAAFAASNQAAGGRYDPVKEHAWAASVTEGVTAEFLAERRGYGLKSPRSIFIIGMPRSGSTLLDQVLSAHPDADSAGETNAARRAESLLAERPRLKALSARQFPFIEALRKGDAEAAGIRYLQVVDGFFPRKRPARVIDKSLVNFVRLPLLKLALPQSRVIHVFRHPLDSALSCFQQDFLATPFATRLDWLAAYVTAYGRYMEAWRSAFGPWVQHVCYEDFVADFDQAAPGVVAAAGMAWDPACARPEANDRLVHTASATQVRGAVTSAAVGKWRRYEAQLAPLIDRLGGVAAIDARYQSWREWTGA